MKFLVFSTLLVAGTFALRCHNKFSWNYSGKCEGMTETPNSPNEMCSVIFLVKRTHGVMRLEAATAESEPNHVKQRIEMKFSNSEWRVRLFCGKQWGDDDYCSTDVLQLGNILKTSVHNTADVRKNTIYRTIIQSLAKITEDCSDGVQVRRKRAIEPSLENVVNEENFLAPSNSQQMNNGQTPEVEVLSSGDQGSTDGSEDATEGSGSGQEAGETFGSGSDSTDGSGLPVVPIGGSVLSQQSNVSSTTDGLLSESVPSSTPNTFTSDSTGSTSASDLTGAATSSTQQPGSGQLGVLTQGSDVSSTTDGLPSGSAQSSTADTLTSDSNGEVLTHVSDVSSTTGDLLVGSVQSSTVNTLTSDSNGEVLTQGGDVSTTTGGLPSGSTQSSTANTITLDSNVLTQGSEVSSTTDDLLISNTLTSSTDSADVNGSALNSTSASQEIGSSQIGIANSTTEKVSVSTSTVQFELGSGEDASGEGSGEFDMNPVPRAENQSVPGVGRQMNAQPLTAKKENETKRNHLAATVLSVLLFLMTVALGIIAALLFVMMKHAE